uniref:Hemocyanin C-terminal domain-containing protein n=1 Tax=Phlebotomus papatasi TaxID=29031 RepID=A0A1B0DD67_PHLPP
MTDKRNLLLLYDRPQEPVFVEKGEQKTVFDVPDNFLPDRYRAIGNELQNRFGEAAENRIPVKNISLPDLRIPMSLGRHEQFSLFIPAHRRPGANTIRRRSTESNVTIPFERTFRDLDANRPSVGTSAEAQFNFCGCGWPQHMLIPKGLPEGLRCELFVMLTNYEEDRIEQDLVGTCNDAFSFCGVRDRLYPDRRPMGFPFDRLPRQGSDRLNTFLTPNMFVVDEHKIRLPPYTVAELTYPNINITNVTVQMDNGGDAQTLRTRFMESDVNLTRGLDFVPRGDVFARFTHLNHEPFTYIINVNNGNNAQVLCTARIFMAPKFDERGTEMMFRDQRHLMIELDRFVIACKYSNSGTHYKGNTKSFLSSFPGKVPFIRTLYVYPESLLH